MATKSNIPIPLVELEPKEFEYYEKLERLVYGGKNGEAFGLLLMIPREYFHKPPFIALRCMLYYATQSYIAAINHAKQLTVLDPDAPDSWLMLAECQSKFENHAGPADALDTLLGIVNMFPEDPRVPYYISVHALAAGNMEVAQTGLQSAVQIDPAYRQKALDDEMLKPLHALISESQ